MHCPHAPKEVIEKICYILSKNLHTNKLNRFSLSANTGTRSTFPMKGLPGHCPCLCVWPALGVPAFCASLIKRRIVVHSDRQSVSVMFAILFLSVCVLCLSYSQAAVNYTFTIDHNAGSPNKVDGEDRVVGGSYVSIRDYPYMAVIRAKGRTHDHCGAAQLNDRWIITAAHCFLDPKKGHVSNKRFFEILTNTDQLEVDKPSVEIERIVFPDNIKVQIGKPNLNINSGDVSLAKATGKLSGIPISLPPPDNKFVGALATVTGFGHIAYPNGNRADFDRRNFLKAVNITILPNDVCKPIYGKEVDYERQLCAGNSDATGSAPGDSGGPLALVKKAGGHVLVGVVSGGKGGAKIGPKLFGRVNAFLPFIEKTIMT